MNTKGVKQAPEFGVKVIWFSPEKILTLKYTNFDDTFKIENFKFDYQLIDFVYGDKVKMVQILKKKPHTIKISNNPYKPLYDINWWGWGEKTLLLKNKFLEYTDVDNIPERITIHSLEYIKYQELYLEFIRIKISLTEKELDFMYKSSWIHKSFPDFTNEHIVEYYHNNFNDCDNPFYLTEQSKMYYVYLPIKNYHFKESHFKMLEMQPYEERIILEEIYHLTKQYLKLNEVHTCNC